MIDLSNRFDQNLRRRVFEQVAPRPGLDGGEYFSVIAETRKNNICAQDSRS